MFIPSGDSRGLFFGGSRYYGKPLCKILAFTELFFTAKIVKFHQINDDFPKFFINKAPPSGEISLCYIFFGNSNIKGHKRT